MGKDIQAFFAKQFCQSIIGCRTRERSDACLIDDAIERLHLLFQEVVDGLSFREKLTQLLVHLFDIRFLSRIEGITIEEMGSQLWGQKRRFKRVELGEAEIAIREDERKELSEPLGSKVHFQLIEDFDDFVPRRRGH